MENLETIAKIFFYVAGPTVAFLALFTWQRELKGKPKHDIAKQILGLIIELRGRFMSAQLRSKLVRSSRNKQACYSWLEESYRKTADLTVDVEIHWGSKESQLLRELCVEMIDIMFIVGAYEPIGSKEEPEYEDMEGWKKILEGNDEKFISELDAQFDKIESKFKAFVR